MYKLLWRCIISINIVLGFHALNLLKATLIKLIELSLQFWFLLIDMSNVSLQEIFRVKVWIHWNDTSFRVLYVLIGLFCTVQFLKEFAFLQFGLWSGFLLSSSFWAIGRSCSRFSSLEHSVLFARAPWSCMLRNLIHIPPKLLLLFYHILFELFALLI